MGNGGILGLISGIAVLSSAVKQVTGELNVPLIAKCVSKSLDLAKKHGVAVIGDLSKGNVEGAINDATSFFTDELKAIEQAKHPTAPVIPIKS